MTINQINHNLLDPTQRGFSTFLRPFQQFKDTSLFRFVEERLARPLEIFEGMVWAYFVYDGVSKVSAKNEKKTFYERVRFQTLDACSDEAYLLASIVKTVCWSIRFFVSKTGPSWIRIASIFSDAGYMYSYGSWMLDCLAMKYDHQINVEKHDESFRGARLYSDAKSASFLGNFSSNYCYAIYSGLSFSAGLVGSVAAATVANVALIGFLFFSLIGSFGIISTHSSTLLQEHDMSLAREVVSTDFVRI